MHVTKQITELPRKMLGHYPTPLTDAMRLSEALGGPRILIKREDLTGLALGGNKCRRLEYLIAHLVAHGYDTIVTNGIGNTATQLVAAGAKCDIRLRCIIPNEELLQQGGNYILHKVLNTDIAYNRDLKALTSYGADRSILDFKEEMYSILESEATKLRKAGYKPFVMRSVDPLPVEHTGWIIAASEIWQQLKAKNIDAQYIVLGTGQGATQTGLLLGSKYFQLPIKVIGISGFYKAAEAQEEILRMCKEAISYLELTFNISHKDVIVNDDYLGRGYRHATKGCIAAIKLVAETEGLFLDPVYSGKAMAGLVDLIRKGQFTSRDTVIFVHTGGIPDFFSYFTSFIQNSGPKWPAP